jgi:hypothetical protein
MVFAMIDAALADDVREAAGPLEFFDQPLE